MKKYLVFIAGLFALLQAIAITAPLQPDQAFQFSAHVEKQQLLLQWQIHPGYQIYRDQIQLKPLPQNQVKLLSYRLPPGQKSHDAIRGAYQYYHGRVTVIVPFKRINGDVLAVKVGYQGCSSARYCYAPLAKNVVIHLDQQPKIKVANSAPMQVKAYLQGTSILWQLLAFFGFGLLLAFTPCVLPMLPILSGIIVGQGHKLTTLKALMLSLVYVLAMAITYAVAGLLLALAGSSLQSVMQEPWVISVFCVIFVVLALSLFDLYFLRLPASWDAALQRLSRHQKSGSYLGVFVMGVLSTLIVSPCVSAPLVGALTFITQGGNVIMGGASLFLLGLGMGVPLLVVGVTAGRFLPKAGAWMNAIKALFGFVLLGMAVFLLDRIVPGRVSLLLWGALLLLVAVYYARTKVISKMVRWLRLVVVLLIAIYAIVLVLGAVMGHSRVFFPFNRYAQSAAGLSFQRVSTLAQLDRLLTHAKEKHQFVFIDFSAQWCVACDELDKYTFTDPQVKRAFANYMRIRVDLTANNASSSQLRKRFNVLGTPSLVFIDAYGNFLPEFNTVGYVTPAALLQLIRQVEKGDQN